MKNRIYLKGENEQKFKINKKMDCWTEKRLLERQIQAGNLCRADTDTITDRSMKQYDYF